MLSRDCCIIIRPLARLVFLIALPCLAGCALVPDMRHAPRYHNPFPQLRDVAVLPFFNLSDEPTFDGRRMASAYYAELQAIPGFIVRPVGQTELLWQAFQQRQGLVGTANISGETFQQFAREIGVDAVVVGAVTEFEPYYPPRLAMSAHWYAANRGFHPIPPGYGLPWGTNEEHKIPRWIVDEAEAALAREQLETQTPQPLAPDPVGAVQPAQYAQSEEDAPAVGGDGYESLPPSVPYEMAATFDTGGEPAFPTAPMPADWPDSLGFIPPTPAPAPPVAVPQSEPVLTHTRIYDGADSEFTRQLEQYYYDRDDARIGGWQNYLTRTGDFLRFCAHLHITQMLESRGGRDESDLILRWPISRYER